MQIIKRITTLLVFICPIIAKAQTTYLPEGSKEYQFIDRFEIKKGNNTDLNFSTLKPYSRRAIVKEIELLDSSRFTASDTFFTEDQKKWEALNLSKIDEYNIHSILMNNSEWVTGSKESFNSKKSLWNTFYKTKSNLLEVNNKDLFLAINPVINFQLGQAIPKACF
jgi:hypothetical protein